MQRQPAQTYSRDQVIASYDFCIAALEEEASGFVKAVAILKEHRAKLTPLHVASNYCGWDECLAARK